MKSTWITATAAAAFALAAASSALAKPTKCHITYNLKGWSAIYETASGEGRIECDNGQSAAVTVRSKGGGVTFGKTDIVDGRGAFSDVADISELFGDYAQMQAQAAAGRAAESNVMTKGNVSLALSGKGKGVELGISFGAFIIEKK